jgi:hypothetical protein
MPDHTDPAQRLYAQRIIPAIEFSARALALFS